MHLYKEKGQIYMPDNCGPLIESWKSGKIAMEAWGRFNYPGCAIQQDALPGLNSIGYWDARIQQQWGLDWHRNEGIELTFLETGLMPFELGANKYQIRPNELTVTRPWQPHKLGDPFIGVGRLHWLILDVGVRHPHQEWVWPEWIVLTKNDLGDLTKILRQNEQPVWQVNEDIRKCFQKIGGLLKGGYEGKESLVMVYINEILVHLWNILKSGNFHLNDALTQGARTVSIFIDSLNTSLIEPWTLEAMADHCEMGNTRFSHYFKELTNVSPIQYLNNIRVEAAAKLLRSNPNLSISTICYDCGFSSTEYFSTVFKKRFNCSPSSYRLQSQ
ncbi:MAG TPA: helix-turn-helix transcriptional regulator [Cytophagaceae bacterium]